MICEICQDTGMVEVDTLPDKQPCLWCDKGKAIWWSQVEITLHVHSSSATENTP